jgi:sigma-B regulation protein RsbU (phosphoserine phosphatase)
MALAEFLNDLQQLERAAFGAQGPLILEAFTRHTPFDAGAVWLRESRGAAMKLAAKCGDVNVDDVLDRELPGMLVVPIRTSKENLGVVALSGEPASDDDLQMLNAAATFLGTLMNNQRLSQEAREGDFQLKYRLWELESLYDIGLSIAATLNIDELADEILFRMISLVNARRAALFLREADHFRVYRSFGDMDDSFLTDDVTRQLLREGTPVTFGEGFVAVPITGAAGIIAVLVAADRESRDGSIGAFEDNELRLLSLFASQVGIAMENARLHREALEKQAMERELELAATIQRDILPKKIPDVAGVEIATFSKPARQVGGDYHAFFEREGVLTMIVADVAGKSIPAALLVSALHAAMHLLFAEGRELGDIATELNRHIHQWSAENKFVTMIMVSIDMENETVRFVNAGHNPCYVVSGDRLDQMKSHGLPIGILGTSKYMTQTRPFPAGSAVVLYSDGITEAENAAGEEFENARLEALLREHSTAGANELRDRIAGAVEAFTGEAPQKDDETLVIARAWSPS